MYLSALTLSLACDSTVARTLGGELALLSSPSGIISMTVPHGACRGGPGEACVRIAKMQIPGPLLSQTLRVWGRGSDPCNRLPGGQVTCETRCQMSVPASLELAILWQRWKVGPTAHARQTRGPEAEGRTSGSWSESSPLGAARAGSLTS